MPGSSNLGTFTCKTMAVVYPSINRDNLFNLYFVSINTHTTFDYATLDKGHVD